MNFAFRLFVLLIGLSPLFLIADNLLVHGILSAYVAVLLLVVALSIRPGEAAFVWSVLRPAALIALVPAVWIVVQAIPLPFNALRHPIWMSAETALGRPLWGSISISSGDTLVALARYFSACGLFFVAVAVNIDRQRAETSLLLLSVITSLMALMLIGHNLGGFLFLGEISSVGPRASLTAAVLFGVVLSSASAIYAVERYETRRNRADFSRSLFLITFALSLGALLVTLLAVLLFGSRPAVFAALSGLGTFVLIVGFRRIGLVAHMGYILAALVSAVPISVIAGEFFLKGADLALQFVTEAPASSIALAQRMISDSNWTGSGAGTFSALLPIYRDTANPIAMPEAPSTAAGFLIELGRPALWLAIAAALGAIAWLTHGALLRGRNSFFTAAGASCAVVLTLEAFFDASLYGSSTIVIVATVLGLALSQTVSRSARQT